ncbi:MAG: 2-C-methyl-D-erythritol 4-phosphate cytidylyltransferase, partial [Lachnospiraceae bacterium]|nr:2-C-methyl-D-erythritol 4-phosphate cytidylyltransferase [Lachnospiraceae bacterium]
MPVKDTIKIADENGDARITPDRRLLWTVQTPQAFSYDLVKKAYDKLFENEERQKGITDDAMVVETMTSQKVHLIKGSYENIKVTTPEDLDVAAIFLRRQKCRRLTESGDRKVSDKPV